MSGPSNPDNASPHVAALAALIDSLPVPTHPPRYWRRGAEFGAAFLDMALRQNHLLRMSERLQFTEVANLARTVTLDLSLDRLTTSQFGAAQGFTAVRQRHRDEAHGGGVAAAGPALVWVAVARLSRADTAPVSVADAHGDEVPRLTQDESRALLNATLYRVLRMILEAHPDCSVRDSPLHDFLNVSNRARWLLQAGIAQLVERGPLPAVGSDPPAPEPPPWLLELQAAQDAAPPRRRDAAGESEAARIRALARRILTDYLYDDQRAFFELLDVAVSDYLLIVGLSRERAEHILTFEGPLLSAAPGSAILRGRHRVGNALPTSSHELVVEYRTELPPGLKSYHLSLEVDPSVRCRRFLQRTTADAAIQGSAVDDLNAVATHLETGVGDEEPKLVEYELQSAVQRVGRLVQARLEDFTRYRAYLARNQVRFTREEEASALTLGVPSAQAASGSSSAPDSFADLALVATEHSAGRLTRLFDTADPGTPTLFRDPSRLRQFADTIDRLELGADATADNDPRENGAHTYWTRRDWPDETKPSGGTLSVVRFTLADDAPSLSGSVVRMIGILIATLYVIFAFLLDDPAWPFLYPAERRGLPDVQADALITVLLLVPGLLLARLDLPSTNTVVGYLRAAPRVLAFTSVGVMVAVAVATAAGLSEKGQTPVWASAALGVLIGAFGLAIIGAGRSLKRRRESSLDALDPPAWLRELSGSPGHGASADVVFAVRETTAVAAPRGWL